MLKEKKLTKRSLLTEDYFKFLAKSANKPAACGTNLYLALIAYAESKKKKLTFGFVEKIKDEEIETIPGVKAVGHKLITAIQKEAKKLA